jgi:hypothetical protein
MGREIKCPFKRVEPKRFAGAIAAFLKQAAQIKERVSAKFDNMDIIPIGVIGHFKLGRARPLQNRPPKNTL